jgi:serine/threonine protein kinase/tetratricopeptide (TPR) repeat protein
MADTGQSHAFDSSVRSFASGWQHSRERGAAPAGAGDSPPDEGRSPLTIPPAHHEAPRIEASLGTPALRFSLHLEDSVGPESVSRSAQSSDEYSFSSVFSAKPQTPFPTPGQVLGGFQIVSELGRGAFGRVFLATQAELSDRPVALKVSKALGNEPGNLARFQHAHIVPIYSVHDDPETGFRMMCMPYVGGANLSQVLETAGARVASQATGRSLLDALDAVGGGVADLTGASRVASRSRLRSQRSRSHAHSAVATGRRLGRAATRGASSPTVVRGIWGRYFARAPWWNELKGAKEEEATLDDAEPARRFLIGATYVQASAWIAARLAEGLEHAHERGLLHRDLKPSNILIAADGTPMLLDFNLSAETGRIGPADGEKAMLGGTLPYMSPEHLDAFNPEGTTHPEAVDERSDLYSLGLIFYEMLAGQHPFPDPMPGARMAEVLRQLTEERLRGARPIRHYNPQVPWSLESILAKCLHPDPDRRYATAGDLAEDLRLFLDDMPLKHAPEPSLRERFRKWARRHPRASSATSVGLVALGLVLGLGGLALSLANHLEGSGARLRREAFKSDFNECQLLLNTTSGTVDHLSRGITLAEKVIRDYKVNGPKDWTAGPLVRRLPRAEQEALREEMSELVQLESRAAVWLAYDGMSENDRKDALRYAVDALDRAERFDPHPTAALYEDRARYEAALGDAVRAQKDKSIAAYVPPKTGRDYYLRGTALLAQNQLDAAESLLARATALEPRRFWAWFALGLCHHAQHRFTEAAGDFAACTALYPEFAWPHLNRGLALAQAGLITEARASYDRALAANPNFIEALVNRGLTCLESGDNAQAEHDLALAIRLGQNDPSVIAGHAEALGRLDRRAEAETGFDKALLARPDDPALLVARGFFRLNGRRDAAEADFARAIAIDPTNVRAHLGRAYLLRETDRVAALAELDRALKSSPAFLDALQLRALLRAREGLTSAEADVDQLLEVPTPRRLYNAACALSILSQKTGEARYAARAVTLLNRALEGGFPRDEAARDPDFDPIRGEPGFP